MNLSVVTANNLITFLIDIILAYGLKVPGIYQSAYVEFIVA